MALSENEKEYGLIGRTVPYCYIIAVLEIVFLPFLKSSKGANVLGFQCHQPYPYIFAGLAVIGLVVFCSRSLRKSEEGKPYNVVYPLVLVILSALAFLGGGKIIVDAYNASEKSSAEKLGEVHYGPVSGLSWGPLLYWLSLLAAYINTVRLNRMIKK